MNKPLIRRVVGLNLLLALLLAAGGTIRAAPKQVEMAFDCATVTEIPQIECEALVALYDATGGDHWTMATNWLQNTTPCTWYGVTCEDVHVTELSLGSNNLTGALPSQIGDLGALTLLSMWSNQLTTLPPEIGNLVALEALLLGGNQLTELPPEIGKLTSLVGLSVWENQLTTFPPEIGNLTALYGIWAQDNVLTTLPSEIGYLTGLEELDLFGNQLATLPIEIGNLSGVTSLNLENNEFTVFPLGLLDLTPLTYLDLSGNNLTSLPSEIEELAALVLLELSSNDLHGIPTEIGNLPALRLLLLDDNPLSGQVPSALTSLSLSRLDYYDTSWCVPPTGPVTTWLSGVEIVHSSGEVCGVAPGSLSGTAVLTNTLPAAGIEVHLYRSLPWSWRHVGVTLTTDSGVYQMPNLGQGIGIGYRVRFVDPAQELASQYYDGRTTINDATSITLTPGEPRTDIDATMALRQPNAVDVEPGLGSAVYDEDGTVQITMPTANRSDITITVSAGCTVGTPTAVTLELSTGPSYPMTAVEGGLYQGTIPAADLNGLPTLTVATQCGGSTNRKIVGSIVLYDPSGSVTNAYTDGAVEGALVTLYQVPGWEPRTDPDDTRANTCESNLSKAPGAAWSQPAPTELGLVANADVTPTDPYLPYQTTTVAGYYGWDVSEGCWYVTVQATGYVSMTSPVVGVPPAVTDLDLALTPYIDFDEFVFLPLAIRSQ